jgi:hypothetical protein
MQWTGKSAFPHARTPKLLGDREESGLRFARFAFHFGTPRVETALLFCTALLIFFRGVLLPLRAGCILCLSSRVATADGKG